MAEKKGTFSGLRSRRNQVDDQIKSVEPETSIPTTPVSPPPVVEKRSPGRPPGRRSNPDYTQISAYIPLDLLLDIQSELNRAKRIKRSRTATNVSELVEGLLTEWLKNQKVEKSKD